MELDIDKTRLMNFVITRQMIENRKGARKTADDYFVSVPAGDYETLIELSIEALRARVIDKLQEQK